jgi:hypothetical protein
VARSQTRTSPVMAGEASQDPFGATVNVCVPPEAGEDMTGSAGPAPLHPHRRKPARTDCDARSASE